MPTENMENAKKTRFLTIILTFENRDMWVDFVILLESHFGSYKCSNYFTGKTREIVFLDVVKLSQTFA